MNVIVEMAEQKPCDPCDCGGDCAEQKPATPACEPCDCGGDCTEQR